MSVPAETERLRFRCWCEDDMILARGLWGDPQVTSLIGGPFEDPAIAARLRREAVHQEQHGVQYWPMFLRATDAHVGCCGLSPVRLDRGGLFELGFHLRPAQWGRGLAGEAARAVIAHGFEALDLPALCAGHHPDNTASQRLLERLGFRYTHHERYEPTGLDHPMYRLERP